MTTPDPMKVSRRDALVTALSLPLILGPQSPAKADSTVDPQEFIPENDYPYFGYEPDKESANENPNV